MKVKHQPRLEKGVKRKPVGSAFMERLELAVRAEMRRFGASRSFVIATAVAFALGVEEQADYRPAKVKRGRFHKRQRAS